MQLICGCRIGGSDSSSSTTRLLSRHMSVRVECRVRSRGAETASPGRFRDRVDELLELVQMTGYRDRYPSQLPERPCQRVSPGRGRWHLGPRCCFWTNPGVLLTRAFAKSPHVASPPTQRSSYDQPFRHPRSGGVRGRRPGDRPQSGSRRADGTAPGVIRAAVYPFCHRGFCPLSMCPRCRATGARQSSYDGLRPAGPRQRSSTPRFPCTFACTIWIWTHERNGRPSWAGQVVRVRRPGGIRPPRRSLLLHGTSSAGR